MSLATLDKIDCDDVSVDVDEDFDSWSFDFRFFDEDDKKKDEIVLVFDMLEFIYFLFDIDETL